MKKALLKSLIVVCSIAYLLYSSFVDFGVSASFENKVRPLKDLNAGNVQLIEVYEYYKKDGSVLMPSSDRATQKLFSISDEAGKFEFIASLKRSNVYRWQHDSSKTEIKLKITSQGKILEYDCAVMYSHPEDLLILIERSSGILVPKLNQWVSREGKSGTEGRRR